MNQNPVPTSRLKSSFKLFSLTTIRGKILSMTLFFLVMLIGFTTLVIMQNQQTQAISKKLVDFRLPITVSAKSIISGLNRVSASQRGFILTKDNELRKERLMVWKIQILPALDVLVSYKDQLSLEANKLRVDSIQRLVLDYQEIQDEIDDYLVQNLMVDEHAQLEADSIHTAGLLIAQVNGIRSHRQALEDKIKMQASPLRKDLRDLLEPLEESNTKYLEQEVSQIESDIKLTNLLGSIVSVVTVILSALVSYLVITRLNISIKKPIALLEKLALGIIPPPEKPVKDELNAIISAGNKLATNIKEASEFALNVGEEKFDVAFTPASDEDTLGNSLVRMRDKLSAVAVAESKRRWINEGHTQMGQILRQDNSAGDWYSKIVSFFVKYLNATQGALYLIENGEDQPYVELKSCLAYGRQKYRNVKLDINEGLVGRCIFEKDNIYLTELPDNYLQITSGLGDATPKNLILVPLIADEEVMGVLELASFSIFEGFQKEFLKDIGETLASTIKSVKTNEETKKLLDISREQAEELQAAEEEMRQNNEELMVTQEKFAAQETYLSGKLKAVDLTVGVVEFDINGTVKDANEKFLKLMGYTLDDVLGKSHRIFCDKEYVNSPEYMTFWANLREGVHYNGVIERVNRLGQTVLMHATYHPQYKNNETIPSSVFKVAYELSEVQKEVIV